MPVLRFDPGAPLVRGWKPATDLELRFVRDDTVVNGSVNGPFVLGDMIWNEVVSDSVTRAWRWSAMTPLGADAATLVVNTPSLLSVSGDRIVSLGTGRGSVTIRNALGARDYVLDASVQAGAVPVLAGYVAGSLSAHVDGLMRSLFLGQTLSNSTAMLSTGWPPNYPANTSRIAPALDLTPVSLLRQPLGESGWTQLYPDLLISPRHGLVTAHAAGAVGDRVLFRRPDNSLQWVTRIGLRSIGDDNAVVYYDQPVAGITPAKLAPTDLMDKLPNLRLGTGPTDAYYLPGVHLLFNSYPHLGLDPGRKVLVTMLTGLFRRLPGNEILMASKRVTDTDFSPYGVNLASIDNSNDGIRGNDSGAFLGFPVQETAGGPITVAWATLCWGPFVGPNFAGQIALINAEMNAQAGTAPGTYAVNTVNLSRFPSFT